MDRNRKTAIIVGTLYIIGTISGILSAVISGPIFDAPNFLTEVSANQTQLVVGALLVLTMGLALAMIPLVMYPILKNYSQSLALGYVVFRSALENVLYLVIVLSWLFLVVTSQAYVQAGPEASNLQALGSLVHTAGDPINNILEIVFSLGALMFYTLLYRSRLIPRWLSGWGLVGVVLYLATGILTLFSLDVGFLVILLGVQEMVMAIWLIAKGFSAPTATTLSN